VSTLQLVELIIIAVVAGAVLYQLYAVLGRRVGRQPEDVVQPAALPRTGDAEPFAPQPDAAPIPVGVAAIRARDPAFDPAKFLGGARQAYELIVTAFASGDRAALERLVSPTVMDGFGKAMTTRATEGRSESVEFSQPPRADLENSAAAAKARKARPSTIDAPPSCGPSSVASPAAIPTGPSFGSTPPKPDPRCAARG
jgi:predicted lipid-binding transport protein (Tim44 family)